MLNEQELIKAFEDKEFAEKIFKLETKEEVQKAFKEEKNIDISFEELEQLQSAIIEITKQLKNGEITEEELANISGGVKASHVTKKIVGITKAVVTVAAAVSVGYVYGYLLGKQEDKSDYLTKRRPGEIAEDMKIDTKRAASDTAKEIQRGLGV